MEGKNPPWKPWNRRATSVDANYTLLEPLGRLTEKSEDFGGQRINIEEELQLLYKTKFIESIWLSVQLERVDRQEKLSPFITDTCTTPKITLTYWFSSTLRPLSLRTQAWVSKSIDSTEIVSVVLTRLLVEDPVAVSFWTCEVEFHSDQSITRESGFKLTFRMVVLRTRSPSAIKL